MDDHPLRNSLLRLQSEIDASLAKEGDYITKISELSTNLNAFTDAYSRARDDLVLRDKRITALENELQALKGHEQRVICLLDGDGAIFCSDLITLGQEGGLEAARLLTEGVRRFLVGDPGHEKFHIWVYLFYNKRGLLETFGRVGLSAIRAKFDEFIIGFNQASERFLMVDVGGSKEAADAKIKVHLQDNIRLPQTQRIIFGGSHDNGYVNILRSVITDGFRSKLILLPGYSDVALDIKALGLPELRIPNLFIANRLAPPSYTSIALSPPPGLPATPRLPSQNPQISNSITPAQAPKDVSDTTLRRDSIHNYSSKSALQPSRTDTVAYEPSDGSGGSPDLNDFNPMHVLQFTPRAPSPGRQRRLNPKIPLSKHMPAPCTLFYLQQCRHGSDCRYAHDYILEEEHYEELRINAKKTPCKVSNEGAMCTWGDDCVYGHVCPQGTTCYYLKLGNCKFKAPGMHRGG